MLKVVEGFHHRVDRKIAGMTAWREEEGEWEYPLVDDAMEYAGMRLIKEYIHRRQATIAAQVARWLIYELCMGSERMMGSSWIMRWWDQDVGREEE